MNDALSVLTNFRGSSLVPVFGLLVDTALKGSLLIGAAALAAYALRGKSAAARHAAWSAAVIGHLALPMLTLTMPQWRLPILPAPPWIQASTATPLVVPQKSTSIEGQPTAAVTAGKAVSAGPESSPAGTSAPDAVSPSPSIDSQASPAATDPVAPAGRPVIPALGLFWVIGAAFVLLRLAIGTWKVGRLAKNGDRVDDGEWLSLSQRLANSLGITRPLTLLRGDRLAVPVTWGVVYPAVLLPHDADEWPEARRRFVLVHEMAHVKRFDALTQLIAQITIALLWFDPLIWIAAHRMRVEREHACDDYVLRDGTTPSLYAGELLEMVQSIGTPRHEGSAPAFAALAMARRSEFEGRMLAILDPRQNRHSLGRASAIVASAALALLVIPLAALRPFESSAPSVSAVKEAKAASGPAKNGPVRLITDTACDSVMRSSRQTSWNHVHVDDDSVSRTIEYLTSSPTSCAQAAIVGDTRFADDRFLSLDRTAYATFIEVKPGAVRSVRVTPRDDGTIEFSARRNGNQVAYDDAMRQWIGRFLPQVLRESSIDVPQRIARDMARGGTALVLARIADISSTSARRAHYEALLDGKPLSESEYEAIAEHVTRTLKDSPSDLAAVLTRIASSPPKKPKTLAAAISGIGRAQNALSNALGAALSESTSSGDSVQTLTKYAVTDDPDMMLMALQGAKDISSSTDKRTLLETIAAGAFRRKSAALRGAYFDVVETIDSDTDRRAVLIAALRYGHADPAITVAVLAAVKAQMETDTDKRAVLVTAATQQLLTTAALRNAFMVAAKSIESSTDYTAVMKAAFKQQ